MKKEILIAGAKGLGEGLLRSMPLILLLDIGFGVGPINWTIKGYNALGLKRLERKYSKILKEGECGTIYFDEKGTKGYVYLKNEGRLMKSYFNEKIPKPDWYPKKSKES